MPKVPRTERTIPLKTGEELRVHFEEYRGRVYLHCRRWWDDNGRMRPGKGLTVAPEFIPWLRSALEASEAAAVNAGLLEAEDFTHHGLRPPPALPEVLLMGRRSRDMGAA